MGAVRGTTAGTQLISAGRGPHGVSGRNSIVFGKELEHIFRPAHNSARASFPKTLTQKRPLSRTSRRLAFNKTLLLAEGVLVLPPRLWMGSEALLPQVHMASFPRDPGHP